MTLKSRIMLVTMAGLIGVLFCYSLMIYVFFVKTSTDAEIQLLWNRAQTVLRKPEVRKAAMWDEAGLLDEFAAGPTMLRIIDPDGNVRSSAGIQRTMAEIKPIYRTAYHTSIINRGGRRLISIQVPIRTVPGNQQIGMLELAKSLHLARGYLRIILLTLASGVVVGSLFAILIAITYSRWIYKPVAELAGTMESIEISGGYVRLSSDVTKGKDEFSRLGLTFNRMMDRLEDHFNRQRQFVQDASHELRTPLTVIHSYAGMLRRWGGSDPVIREEAVTAIEQESARLKELVASLLQLADHGNDHPQMQVLSFDLWKLAQRTSQELSRSFKRRIDLEGGASTGNFQLEGNPEKVKQLLIILLDNALKYSAKSIIVRLETGKDGVLLQVIDQGAGIAREHIRHLFDRFYRADADRNRKTGGSGLGLSIARKIVEDHDGNIKVSSKPGRGTTVSVYLPHRQKAAPMEGAADSTS
jgi:two-component system, OmpR family, sensor histidine kinase ArlS